MVANKTIIKQLESKKVEAVEETRKLYNEAIKFYFELLQDHQELLELATKPLLNTNSRNPIKPNTKFSITMETASNVS